MLRGPPGLDRSDATLAALRRVVGRLAGEVRVSRAEVEAARVELAAVKVEIGAVKAEVRDAVAKGPIG